MPDSFCKRSKSTCFGISGPHMVSIANYSTSPLRAKVAMDNTEMNELCSNITCSVDPGISEFHRLSMCHENPSSDLCPTV